MLILILALLLLVVLIIQMRKPLYEDLIYQSENSLTNVVNAYNDNNIATKKYNAQNYVKTNNTLNLSNSDDNIVQVHLKKDNKDPSFFINSKSEIGMKIDDKIPYKFTRYGDLITDKGTFRTFEKKTIPNIRKEIWSGSQPEAICEKRCLENPFCSHYEFTANPQKCSLYAPAIQTPGQTRAVLGLKQGENNKFKRFYDKTFGNANYRSYDELNGIDACEKECISNKCDYYTFYGDFICNLSEFPPGTGKLNQRINTF